MPTALEDHFVVDFPTMWVVPDWIERHCVLPDIDGVPDLYEMYEWQLWCTVNHYRVRPTAMVGQLATAFHNRRSQIVGPQKCGKGPWTASIICAEARGPVRFDGFAGRSDAYVCSDFGCSCGWEYEYAELEPMGVPWGKPLIQISATSIDQVEDNIYAPLQWMIRRGPLIEQMRVGDEMIRLPNDGEIVPVTSNANSKLGNPITFAVQDETGLYTESNGLRKFARTQRRGAAGIGGRTMETTNAWDPVMNSVAQQTHESKAPDIFKFFRQPPAHWSYKNKAERAKIHRYVYRGSLHVDLDAIEAEAVELMELDVAEAERFYGNKLVQGAGAWLLEELWEASERLRVLA